MGPVSSKALQLAWQESSPQVNASVTTGATSERVGGPLQICLHCESVDYTGSTAERAE